MILAVNFIIVIVFIAYLVYTWKSTKTFEGYPTRILYMLIGTAFIAFLTFLFFLFSSIGVDYPNPEMVGDVRREILFTFVPLNGFILLPQISNLISKIKDGDTSKESLQKRIRIFLIIFGILIVFECIYFKNIQNGIINYINLNNGG